MSSKPFIRNVAKSGSAQFLFLSSCLLIVFSLLGGCQVALEEPVQPEVQVQPQTTANSTLNTDGPAISPLLVGNNVWRQPGDQVWNISAQAGLQLIRIGGNAYDDNMLPTTMLANWVKRIKAMDAEPMVQVSRFDGPEAAAEIVKYFNIDGDLKVKFWNIGNEPHCGEDSLESASDVAAYIKEISVAMKAVDPTIMIFAPDECDFHEIYYTALLAGDNSASDISGKVPGQNYYYIDGISWHRYVGYPPEKLKIEQLTTAGANDFLVRIQKTRQLIDKANQLQGRSGADALQWGIGEFNGSEGQRVCSYENGQMFAEIYGYLMKYNGTYATTWSMYENGGKCNGTDFSFVGSDMQPRATFYHMQMISQNFSGNYLDGISNLDEIRSYGAVNLQTGQIAVMLLNIDTKGPQTCAIRLDANPIQAGTCQVNIPAGIAVEVEQTIDSQTSMVLVFDLQGKLRKTITYSRSEHWSNSAAPTVADFTE
ncbi:MAG: hypothetical protein CVU44_08530 [Chloroflexi bacterium HGW-Chloroflexi-6]|nr:MAG: hypothetical protein CVU44_08530 [Chloroflexi bacterium HGW-Chloroflexi-6]